MTIVTMKRLIVIFAFFLVTYFTDNARRVSCSKSLSLLVTAILLLTIPCVPSAVVVVLLSKLVSWSPWLHFLEPKVVFAPNTPVEAPLGRVLLVIGDQTGSGGGKFSNSGGGSSEESLNRKRCSNLVLLLVSGVSSLVWVFVYIDMSGWFGSIDMAILSI